MLSVIRENLRFMVNEVESQASQTLQFFNEPSRALVERINSRDDYIDTLKSLIQEKTYSLLLSGNNLDKNDVHFLRSINTISANLERIADFAVNMLRQAEHLTDMRFLSAFPYPAYFAEVLGGLSHVQVALERREVNLAYGICRAEFKLDELYGSDFARILAQLRAGGPADNLITSLMILHYLERMGDSLLNIGEAILFAVVGESLKIHQYRALTESLNASGLGTPLARVEFESIWGTRSGCRIGVVGPKNRTDNSRPVLFKHGNLKKLQREKENIERWNQLIPGLPPQVREFIGGSDGEGSILLEYLPGCTFQELLITGDEALMRNALFMIQETLGQVWRETCRPGSLRAGFVEQIRSRMESIERVHPHLRSSPAEIGQLRIGSFGQLLMAIEAVEDEFTADFSVFIHGDFNINNIIFDHQTERLHFIDLHRGAQSDYLQDVSVFLISIFRLPFFESRRHRLNYAIMDFFEFAKEWAQINDDRNFEARLALGLSRSLFTSTRFELKPKFVRVMYQRSVYLLEKLLDHRGRPWSAFSLPGEVLVL